MKEDINTLLTLAKDRNEKQAAWYRQLLTLASGGLALLVGLQPEVPALGPARFFLAGAWALLGAGILFGGAATYSEVSLARRLAENFQDQLLRSIKSGEELSANHPVVANPHRAFLWAKPLMVVSLLGAVVCLVAFSIITTLD